MIEQAQGIQGGEAPQEIPRLTVASPRAPQKNRCHHLREFTRIRAEIDIDVDDHVHLRLAMMFPCPDEALFPAA